MRALCCLCARVCLCRCTAWAFNPGLRHIGFTKGPQVSGEAILGASPPQQPDSLAPRHSLMRSS